MRKSCFTSPLVDERREVEGRENEIKQVLLADQQDDYKVIAKL